MNMHNSHFQSPLSLFCYNTNEQYTIFCYFLFFFFSFLFVFINLHVFKFQNDFFYYFLILSLSLLSKVSSNNIEGKIRVQKKTHRIRKKNIKVNRDKKKC